MSAPAVGDLLQRLAPQVLGALVRRHGQFDVCEDAVQEALIDAAAQWPEQGVPDDPRAWLLTVASRRLVDRWRSEHARRRREQEVAALDPQASASAPDEPPREHDDTLALLFLCCHPSLTPASQVALTLRAVGGLTTDQIARAFLVPEATMAQRIGRAKQRIKADGATFRMPAADERGERLRAVLHVLYLVFNEGYAASSGPDLRRGELTGEAIRLARLLRRLLPEDPEVAGLLALMLLTDARRDARTTAEGDLVPLAEQDRARWDRGEIAEGAALLAAALPRGRVGAYQLQAAIAAVHAEAARAEDTDWRQILALYGLLERIEPNPMVTLNRAVALAMVDGPRAGLELLAPLAADERLAEHHRLAAVRAHLHELAGETDAAIAAYREAARRTTSLPEQRYLEARAARLAGAHELTVRAGAPHDEAALLALFDEAVVWLVARGQAGQWGAEPFSQRPELRARVRRIVAGEGLWIAERDGRPVGALVVGPAPTYAPPAAGGAELYVDLLLSARRLAGHGIGARLLEQAVRLARERGCEQLRTDCWAHADGLIRWYEQRGFERAGALEFDGWRGQLLALPLH